VAGLLGDARRALDERAFSPDAERL